MKFLEIVGRIMERPDLINIILLFGIILALVCIILPWVVFEPLVEDPLIDDWRQFNSIGILLSGDIYPVVGVLLFIVGTVITIWYPIGSGLQLVGLIIFGITASDLVSNETIAYEMDNAIGYVGAWFATLMIVASTIPYIRDLNVEQARGVEDVGKYTERLSGDAFRILMIGGMRRRW